MAKSRGFNEALTLNAYATRFYRNKMRLLACTMFKWEGLPNGIPSRFIEKSLFYNGLLAFVDDEELGLICCKANLCGNPNLYDEGVRYQLYANNGYSKIFDREDIVLLRNNKDEIPTKTFTDYYVKRFYEMERTIDVNVIQQKTSRIVLCEQSQKLTLENLFMQWEGNTPLIFGYKDLKLQGVDIKDLKVEYVADKIQILKGDLWREFLDTLGINNANTMKRERMITDEVNSNNDFINLANDVFLETREECAKLLNKKWGKKYNFNTTVIRRVDEYGELHSNIGLTD